MKMNKYLTPELKSYYMKDFEEKVVPLTTPSWKLDDGVLDYLREINENPLIQTLYSKMHGPSSSMMSAPKSYLKFTYTEELEDALFKEFIPKITTIFSSKKEDSICYYSFNYPELGEDDNETIIDMGCTKSGIYLDVNHIQIDFVQDYPDKHAQFWKVLTKNLAQFGQAGA